MIKKFVRFVLFLLCPLLIFCSETLANDRKVLPSGTLSLGESISHALSQDPQLQIAIAAKDSNLEIKSQAIANLLPSVSAVYQRNPRASTDTLNKGLNQTNTWSTSDYSATSKALQLKQPIFRPRLVATLLQSYSQVDQAELKLKSAINQTIIRSLSSYADWLTSEANLKFAQANAKALQMKELQIGKMLKSGLSALPDLSQATADKFKAQAELSFAKQEFNSSKEDYFNIIGSRLKRPELIIKNPNPETITLKETEEQLLQQVLNSNYELLAAQKDVEIASYEIKKYWSDHAPSVDFVASKSESDSFSDIAIGRQTRTTTLGIVINIPLYQGGFVNSTIRQAEANLRKAEAEYLNIKNRIQRDFYKSYDGLNLAQDKWAHAQANFEAAKVNLRSTLAQEKSGLKNKIELAYAERNLTQSEKDLIQAKMEWVLAKASILSLMGKLDEILGQEEAKLLSGTM